MDPGGKGGVKGLGETEGEETVIRIFYVRGENLFSLKYFLKRKGEEVRE